MMSSTSASEENIMGGKPNPGTSKDKRLKANKPKASRKGKGKK